MKLFTFVAFLAVLVTTVLAWTKEDHEIFDLVSALEAAEGKGTTFYSWLDVSPSASSSEIGKAYRKMSMVLHPDKNPGKKNAHERFSRLGVIAAILRNSESRKHYDFFFKNGVPKWRGTGYYYSRFRPGLGTVVVFLIMLTSALQYLVQKMNYKRDLERVERIMHDARAAAWGPKMVPLEGKRKVKVKLGGRSDEDDFSSGRWIDMVVDGQDVYILESGGELHPLDSSAAIQPTISGTWFVALIKHYVGVVISKVSGAKLPADNGSVAADLDGDDSSSDISDATASGTNTPRDSDSDVKGRVATVKAGGMRRKAVRKRK